MPPLSFIRHFRRRKNKSNAPAPMGTAFESEGAAGDIDAFQMGRCRLLELPRELRDMIYEFALTEKGGLVKDSPFNGFDSEGQATGKFWAVNKEYEKSDPNPLKLVCRQLYAETSGLGLRYNTLVFCNASKTTTSLDLLQTFVTSECSKTQLGRIRNIIVANHPAAEIFFSRSGSTRQLNLLTCPLLKAWAQNYPQTEISILVTLPSWGTYEKLWTHIGSCLQYLLHGTLPSILSPRSAQKILSFCVYVQSQALKDAFVFPDNFRFFPSTHGGYLTDQDDDELETLLLPDSWMKQFREWRDHGF